VGTRTMIGVCAAWALVAAAGGCQLIAGLGDPRLAQPDGGTTGGSGGATGTSSTGSGGHTATGGATGTSSAGSGGHIATGTGGATGTSSAGSGGSPACIADSECPPYHKCSSSGVCLLATAQPCTLPSQCLSNFCVDGVCCNALCNMACHACAAKFTGGMDGVCAPATDGTMDPRTDCLPTPETSCGVTGVCSQGECLYWDTNVICGTVANSCLTNPGPVALLCDGMGNCNVTGPAYACPQGCAMDLSHCYCQETPADCPSGFPVCNNEEECVPL
jgi:hypothetical protein